MVRIEKNKPLPDHTKLRYQECYAKILLERCVPKFKSGLQMRDKPDLYCSDCDTGIEVTDIMSKEKREAVKLWYTMPYVKPEQQERNIDRMKQLGVEYSRGVQTWPTITYDNGLDSTPYQELYGAIKKKLHKLNNGNQEQFSSNELLLFTELLLYDCVEYRIVDRLESCQNDFVKKYDTLYIVTIDWLLCYDMKSNTLEKRFFDQYTIATLARDMVEKGENDG